MSQVYNSPKMPRRCKPKTNYADFGSSLFSVGDYQENILPRRRSDVDDL